jgi:hypothetical protein
MNQMRPIQELAGSCSNAKSFEIAAHLARSSK